MHWRRFLLDVKLDGMNGAITHFIAVGFGGAIGAVLRYVISGVLQTRVPLFRPAGTLVVNVVGCLLIGCCMAVVANRPQFSETWRLFLITGILGSLTTFSTFSYETIELMREQNYRLAAWNIAGNLLIGFGGVWVGWIVADAMSSQ